MITFAGLSLQTAERETEYCLLRSNFWTGEVTFRESEKTEKTGRIISLAQGDLDGDGEEELLLLTGKGFQGGVVKVFSKEGELLYAKDFSKLRPWKLDGGDVTGDGKAELALGIVKKTPLDPVLRRRCFFYRIDLNRGKLIPVYRASRFSRPFYDFALYDIDGDGVCEVLAGEDDGGSGCLAVYRWHGFGFFLEEERSCEPEVRTLEKIDDELYINGKISRIGKDE